MNRLQRSTLYFVLSAATLLGGQSKSLEELTLTSPLIVLGRVSAADSYVGADGEIYTGVSVTPDSVLQDATGAADGPAEIRFTVKGGTIGDRVVYFSDAPQFTAGEDVAIFGDAAAASFEKITLDPVRGLELLRRIGQAREDAGDPIPAGRLNRARAFVRQADRSGRDRGGEIELNAVSCSAYMGPKWPTPATTYSLASTLPTAWAPGVQAASQSWNTGGSRFAFSLNSSSPHSVLLGDLGATGPLASTRVEYYQSSQQLVKFTLTFNNKYGWTITGEAGKFDVQAIATHELGHALGLNHPADTTCNDETMWASAAAGETKKRSLEAGDKAGVVSLYGSATAGSTPAPAPTPAPAQVAAPVNLTNFALVAARAVATKPVVLLFQGTGIDPAKLQGLFIGGACGTAGCVATPYSASELNAVFINSLPAGAYSVAIRNSATGTLSAARTFTVNAQ